MNTELLEKVKTAMGHTIPSAVLDNKISTHIEAVRGYLISGGAKETVGENDLEINCIAIGVSDLMNQTAGGVKFSPAFNMIAKQICSKSKRK